MQVYIPLFKETVKMFSKDAVRFVFLSVMHGCFSFQHLVLTTFLEYRLSSQWYCYLLLVLIFIFLMTKEVEHLFLGIDTCVTFGEIST